MIDFVKFVPLDVNVEKLEKKLDFESVLNEKTGELKLKYVKYRKMTIKVLYPSQRVEVAGSLHKFYNDLKGIYSPGQSSEKERAKGFNGNDFKYVQLCIAINYVSFIIETHPDKCILSNIEFGLNIVHCYVSRYILNNLFRHYGKPFTEPQPHYFQAEHGQYFVKCYDKQNQYGLPHPCIRIEVKHVKMEALHKEGVHTLADLMNKTVLTRLNNVLSIRWQQVLLYDYTIRESELNNIQRGWLTDFKNKNFWNLELKPCEMYRHKERLSEITANNSERIHAFFTQQIRTAWKDSEQSCITVDRLFRS